MLVCAEGLVNLPYTGFRRFEGAVPVMRWLASH